MAFAYSLVKERPGQRARGTPSVKNRTQETEFRRQNVEFFLLLFLLFRLLWSDVLLHWGYYSKNLFEVN